MKYNNELEVNIQKYLITLCCTVQFECRKKFMMSMLVLKWGALGTENKLPARQLPSVPSTTY